MRIVLKLSKSNGAVVGGEATAYRDSGPKIYSESAFWYAVKEALQKQGHDVIKKLMEKDGHMVSSNVYYVRSRKYTPESFYLYDSNYATRFTYEPYNQNGQVVLRAEPGLSQEGMAEFESKRKPSAHKTSKKQRSTGRSVRPSVSGIR